MTKNLIPALICLFLAIPCQAGIIYVDDDASVGGDGLSWGTPYKYLQDALDDAESGDDIWVAAGTYRPDDDTANHPDGTGLRTDTFQLLNGVALYGGYAGYGATDPNARNVELYETILSGDLDGNDTLGLDPCDLWDDPNRGENSYHVVMGSGTDATAVLEGFTITAGNANWPSLEGGGMYNELGNPTVMNCTFGGNSAGWGGAMFNRDSSPTLINCTFTGNSVYDVGSGGGMYNTGTAGLRSSPMLTNCTFIGNSGGYAGGMANIESNPTLTNCTFSKNSVNGYGGGIANAAGNPTLTNCTFSGNSAYYWGGGMYNHYGSPTLTNCTFTGNSSENYGGGMYNYFLSSPTLTNCILWSNTAPSGPQIYNDGTSSATVRYSDVQGSWPGEGNINTDPCFVDLCNGDYHLKSFGWRWGSKWQEWDFDRVTSRCIDAGNPGSPLRDELMTVPDDPCNIWGENIRINMGAYGGTAEASMPPYDWTLLSDITNDGTVDFVDFAHFADTLGDQDDELPGDFDRDGDVDYTDLFLLTEDWLRETTWHQ